MNNIIDNKSLAHHNFIYSSIDGVFKLLEKQVQVAISRHNEFPQYIWTSTGSALHSVLTILKNINKRIEILEENNKNIEDIENITDDHKDINNKTHIPRIIHGTNFETNNFDLQYFVP